MEFFVFGFGLGWCFVVFFLRIIQNKNKTQIKNFSYFVEIIGQEKKKKETLQNKNNNNNKNKTVRNKNRNKIMTDNTVAPHPLSNPWNFYYHLPQEKAWDLASYKLIQGNIKTAEDVCGLVSTLTPNMIKYSMLFVMRQGITPMWEDPKNRNGGCFSYKVANKFVPDVWKTLFYALCGETLSTDPKYSKLINGITISPKKNFCIIKIWLTDYSLQDGSVILDIPNLTRQGVAFKKHAPEF